MEKRRLQNTTVVISILALQSQKGKALSIRKVRFVAVLAVECMLPSKLKRHLTTNHNYLSGKPREFFACKLLEMNEQSVLFTKFLHTPTKAQFAFFKAAYRIAKCKKPHTIAEELVLSAALDLVPTMIRESFVQKLKAVPLSHNTISRRIDKIADDINRQLLAKMRRNEFSLQLDEATVSTRHTYAYLICYIRFIDNGDNIVCDTKQFVSEKLSRVEIMRWFMH